jgi:hypothetical protein
MNIACLKTGLLPINDVDLPATTGYAGLLLAFQITKPDGL